MGKTSIEWTDRTWNPIRGCSRVSEGCRNCYAEQVAARFSGEGQAYHGLARRRSNGEAQWTGDVRLIEEHLSDPLSWRTPARVFVNSMSDLFHEKLTDEQIDQVFAVMALAAQHTFQILTKRPERMLQYFAEIFQRRTDLPIGPLDRHGKVLEAVESIVYRGEGLTRFHGDRWWTPEGGLRAHTQPWPLPNVWLGVSTENQETADERIPLLLQTPAAIRFLSCEPLLGPIEFTRRHQFCPEHDFPGGRCTEWHEGVRTVDWVIVGGESGRDARVLDLDWMYDIVAQCDFAGTPVFVKQLGKWIAGDHAAFPSPVSRWLLNDGRVWVPGVIGAHNYERPADAAAFSLSDSHGGDMAEWPEDLRIRQFPAHRNTTDADTSVGSNCVMLPVGGSDVQPRAAREEA